ncbi:MAG: hypothetical protein WBB01_25920 [Phormidesmis sp.]
MIYSYKSDHCTSITAPLLVRFQGDRNPIISMDIKLVLFLLTGLFMASCLFFGTRNGFYDSENYHGNGSAH